ncbi:MAG: flagellar export chaperone FliS [Cellvibrionaceae bacterium]
MPPELHVISNDDKSKHYQELGNVTKVQAASPHRLIQLLFEGALEALARAQGAIEHDNLQRKGDEITKAIEIVGGLRNALNMEEGELPYNLDRLYEYMQVKLVDANRLSDPKLIIEVVGLLQTLKEGWDGIQSS